MTSNRPRWAGNITPDPDPLGGGGAAASQSPSSCFPNAGDTVTPKPEAGSSSCPSLPQPPEKQPASSLHCQGPALVLKGSSKAAHICCCSHWQLRHQDTHCSAQQLHGTGPSSPILSEAFPCPAHSMNTKEEWLQEAAVSHCPLCSCWQHQLCSMGLLTSQHPSLLQLEYHA